MELEIDVFATGTEKLIPDSVQNISKNIANFLYDPVSVASNAHGNQRLGVLQMLQKWCISGRKHFRINCSNYDCFVDYLVGITDSSADAPLTTECDEINNFDLDITSSTIAYYKKLAAVNSEKIKTLDVIKKRDHEKFGNTFDYNYDSTCTRIPSTCVHVLASLSEQQGCACAVTSGAEINHVIEQPKNYLRQKQINLAYALLNLNSTSLLLYILKRIAAHGELNSQEIKLVNYIWQNYEKLNLPLEVPHVLLENFSFVYENYFINLCTSVLQLQTNEDFHEGIQNILRLIADNKKLRLNVINLLYQLYACSGYNTKLYNLINSINRLI